MIIQICIDVQHECSPIRIYQKTHHLNTEGNLDKPLISSCSFAIIKIVMHNERTISASNEQNGPVFASNSG